MCVFLHILLRQCYLLPLELPTRADATVDRFLLHVRPVPLLLNLKKSVYLKKSSSQGETWVDTWVHGKCLATNAALTRFSGVYWTSLVIRQLLTCPATVPHSFSTGMMHHNGI